MRTGKGQNGGRGLARGSRLGEINRRVTPPLACSRRPLLDLLRRWFAKLAAIVAFILTPPPPLFGEIADAVLKEYESTKAEATNAAAMFQIGRLKSFFGRHLVTNITTLLWLEYVATERAKKERIFFDDRKYMRIVLGAAVEAKHLESVPRLPIPEIPADTGRELTPGELHQLRKAADPDTPDESGQFQKSRDLLFQIDIAWKMGLRSKEIRELTWDEVNLETELIRIRARDRKNKRALQIPINPDLVTEFYARRARARCKWVFPNEDMTGPITSFKTAWRRCKREAGVRCRFHDLRHTCASLMLRAGNQRRVVKEMLSISDQVLDLIYTHFDLEDMKRATLATQDAAVERAPITAADLRTAAAAVTDEGLMQLSRRRRPALVPAFVPG